MDSVIWGGVWKKKKYQMLVTEARDVPEGFRAGCNGCCLLSERKESYTSYTFSVKLLRRDNHLLHITSLLNESVCILKSNINDSMLSSLASKPSLYFTCPYEMG